MFSRLLTSQYPLINHENRLLPSDTQSNMVRCSRICCILSIRCGSEVRWISMGMRIPKIPRDCWVQNHWLLVPLIDGPEMGCYQFQKSWYMSCECWANRECHQGISIKINWTWGLKPNQKKQTWNEDDLPIREFPTIWNWSPRHCHLQVRFKTGNQWLGPIITHVWTCFTAMWNNSCY